MQPLDVCFYHPMKLAWRNILTSWKKSCGTSRASLPKDQFPVLLKKLMANLEPNVCTNLTPVSGFKTCGLVPIDRTQIMKKLPASNVPNSPDTAAIPDSSPSTRETPVKSRVSSAVMTVLQKMRFGDGDNESGSKRKARRPRVHLFKAIFFTPVNINTLNTEFKCVFY